MSADGALKMFTSIGMCTLTLRTENSASLHLVTSHLIDISHERLCEESQEEKISSCVFLVLLVPQKW